MKKVIIALAAVLAVLLIVIVVQLSGLNLRVSVLTVETPAEQNTAEFDRAQRAFTEGTAPQLFSASFDGSASDYTVVEADVTIKNAAGHAAEWINCTVMPAEADILVYEMEPALTGINARGEGTLHIALISREAHAQRSLVVSYYLYGRAHTVKVKL